MSMEVFRDAASQTGAINAKLFGAVLFGGLAWLMWPSSYEWWGFGTISILCGMASTATLVEAVRLMVSEKKRRDAIDAYEALGASPKSSRMASEEALRQAGMLDV